MFDTREPLTGKPPQPRTPTPATPRPLKAGTQTWQRTFRGAANGVTFQLRIIRQPNGHLSARYQTQPGPGKGWHLDGQIRDDNTFSLTGRDISADLRGVISPDGKTITSNFTGLNGDSRLDIPKLILKYMPIPVNNNNDSNQNQHADELDGTARKFNGVIDGNTYSLFLRIIGNQVTGFIQDIMDTPQQGYAFNGEYISSISGSISQKMLTIEILGRKRVVLISDNFTKLSSNGIAFSQAEEPKKAKYQNPDGKVNLKSVNFDISQLGIQMITSAESFSEIPYDDGVGYLTIGFGHKLSQIELEKVSSLRSQGKQWKITRQQGMELFHKDLRPFIDRLNKALKVDISQSQFDSLCSLMYNWGNVEGADIIKEINLCKSNAQLDQVFITQLQRVYKAKDNNDLDKDGNKAERIGLRGLMNRRGRELEHAIGGYANVTTSQSSPESQNESVTKVTTYNGLTVSFDATKFTDDVDYPIPKHNVSQGGYAISESLLAKTLSDSRGKAYSVGAPLLHTATEYMATGRDYGGYSSFHTGWDFNVGSRNSDRGEDVLSASDGIVIFSGTKGTTLGYFVIIEHPQLKQWTRYAHMSENLLVKEGQIVKKGEHIGDVDNTGDRSMFTHLHFDVSRVRLPQPQEWNGEYSGIPRDDRREFVLKNYVDPYNFFKGKVSDIK
ncbi:MULTISPECIES: peptidoglycan DD-metalloendopeptidase family protein [unclassified Deinococcus]|uniref:peptidoglycan DD-metalloendopeptidase family protein n=1 Tax=unclassified Deinococcus TaxID=2623546 RepID=UPI001C304086|nr:MULTISPECIES: peptidoglycan DD-metalloendopeptidase family protein [unclassified Deinococcus]MDK2013289.1 peptidoglycan DD-metalloendopeptidase family protein [Deinococcus sp. 43]